MKLSIAGLILGFTIASPFPRALAEGTPASEEGENAVRKQISELQWIRGPQQVQLFGNSTLSVPSGYVFLNPWRQQS